MGHKESISGQKQRTGKENNSGNSIMGVHCSPEEFPLPLYVVEKSKVVWMGYWESFSGPLSYYGCNPIHTFLGVRSIYYNWTYF